MVSLNDVFGIKATVPTYTYVDRAHLDANLKYYLGCDRHIVIHGPSKQGKTSLRRKCLPDDQTFVVQCRPTSTLDDLYHEILTKLKAELPVQTSVMSSLSGEVSASGSGGVRIPFFAHGNAGAGALVSKAQTKTSVTKTVEAGPGNLGYLIEQVKFSGRRCIIEDFHYLPEDQQKRLAFDLKSFWDASVFVIIVGVWAQRNLLTYYNPDLSGRVEEIDVQWTNAELDEVIERGQDALNIRIADVIRHEIIEDAAHNVGLLQRLAERFCYECHVLTRQDRLGDLADQGALERARQRICADYEQRYRQFSSVFEAGFQRRTVSLHVYRHILRAIVEASITELNEGLTSDALLKKVQVFEDIRQSDLTAALQRVDKLQLDRGIRPLVISYNPDTRRIVLVDRELLFYRKYGNHRWPWNPTTDD